MKKLKNKYILGVILSVVLAFFWIFLTVFLTKGKEISDFNETESIIFGVFVAVEVMTWSVAFAFAIMLGKKYHPKIQQVPEIDFSKRAKAEKRKESAVSIFVVVSAFLLQLAGIVFAKNFENKFTNSSIITAFVVSIVIPIILLAVNIILQKFKKSELDTQNVKEITEFILSHRESAEETTKQKESLLKKIIIKSQALAIVYGVCGIVFSVSLGMFCKIYGTDFLVPLFWVSVLFILCALSRIRVKQKVYEDEEKFYLSETEYPEIYKVTKKAADALGCKEEIKILLSDDCNAGISKKDNKYFITLGVVLLNIFTKEELYNVLLHEFSHVSEKNLCNVKLLNYNEWLCYGSTTNLFSAFIKWFFVFLDEKYKKEYFLYSYASSVINEETADKEMLKNGDKNVAASALIKLKYNELYDWETGTYDEECVFEPEKLQKGLVAKSIENLKSRIISRKEFWNRFIDIEILSRSASHPTLKMRLERLGVKNYEILPFENSGEYQNECKKALEQAETLLYEEKESLYEEGRNSIYLDSLEIIENWEKSGKPIIASEYADVVVALRQLGRNIEANECCKRAIDELSDIASSYAHFMYGCFLLHSFNDEGLNHIYKAIENSNFIEEGLENIGKFCCLTGNKEELEIYREKAVDLIQSANDKYIKIQFIDKKDVLVTENLPDGMLEDILSFIKSIDENKIRKIYLVRKVITDDFFTSVFIIDFEDDVDDEIKNKVMHKIFSYLDKCFDWQFSLFFFEEIGNVDIEKIENSCVFVK